MMLNFYTSEDWNVQGRNPVVMLHPFLNFRENSFDEPDGGRYEGYYAIAKQIFAETTQNEADVFVFPIEFSRDPETLARLDTAITEAKSFGKNLLLFYNADDDKPIQGSNLIIYRTSFYASSRMQHEFAIPGWSVDFTDKYFAGQLSLRNYHKKPSISYCGYVDFPSENLFYHLNKLFGRKKSFAETMRGAAVRALRSYPGVDCNFIIREGFWAAGVKDKIFARRQYVENMANSDYAFVCRGGGNFSYRLYEAMSLGRIPLFFESDGVLPFEHLIPWDEIMVRIPQSRMSDAASILEVYHAQLGEEGFRNLQIRIREVYLQYIAPAGFFSILAQELKERK